jgi:hypothetical protein
LEIIDIIAEFAIVSNITQMPRDQLCHAFYVRRLALMQASQFSIYNADYKAQLEYVYSQCNINGPTAIPPPLVANQPSAPLEIPAQSYCLTGNRYTTKQGDTCDSVATISGVSTAALYMGNQKVLPDCQELAAGLTLCIPLTCTTYRVKSNDTCLSIEKVLGLEIDAVRGYNAWIKSDCSNLQPGTDFYGKNICVSPQGG